MPSQHAPTARALAVVLITTALSMLALATPRAGAAPGPGAAPERATPRSWAYIYDASFTAEITHDLQLHYYDERDGHFAHATATIAGTMPGVTVTGTSREDAVLSSDASKGTLRTLSGSVDTTTRTDSGRTEVHCVGDSIWAAGAQRPSVIWDLKTDQDVFQPFGLLSLPRTCTDNQGSPPTEGVHSFPAIKAPMTFTSGQLGDKSVTLTFHREISYDPDATGDEACPGQVRTLTDSCTYKLTGTMKLSLVKKVEPGKQPKASITKGATKASLSITCPARCTTTVTVMPLTGSRMPLAQKRVSPRAGEKTTVTVPIPAAKRKHALRSGGVRLEVTYRLAAGLEFSETRIARL